MQRVANATLRAISILHASNWSLARTRAFGRTTSTYPLGFRSPGLVTTVVRSRTRAQSSTRACDSWLVRMGNTVRFNITAPSIPVVVRLQLVLYEKDGHVPRTLTLPPVVLKPTSLDAFPDDLEAGVDPTSYIVTVLGYSQVVREVHQPDNGTFLLVKRIGTARFGSGVRQQATP